MKVNTNTNRLIFDYKNLVLYKHFLTNHRIDTNESDFQLIIYDFIQRFLEIEVKVDAWDVIKAYFLLFTGDCHKMIQKLKRKDYFPQSETVKSEYTAIVSQKDILTKKPFCYFVKEGGIKLFDILTNGDLFENFLYIQLNYAYYLIFSYNDDKVFTPPLIHPKSIHKKILASSHIPRLSPNITIVKSVLNSVFRFLDAIPKTSFLFIFNNENCIELILHLLIHKIVIDNKNKVAEHVIYRLNKLIVVQTLIMLTNLNKDNKAYTSTIGIILSKFFMKSYSNILIVLNMFDMSNINYDTSAVLIKKLFLSVPNSTKREYYFQKVLSNLFQAILSLKNTQNKNDENIFGVMNFLIDIVNQLMINFGDELMFNMVLYVILMSNFLKRFGKCVRVEDNNNNRHISITDWKLSQNPYDILTPSQIDYVTFLTENFLLAIKSGFSKLLDSYDSGIFDIYMTLLMAFSTEHSVFYDNLSSGLKSRLFAMKHFLVIQFDLIAPEVLARQYLNFYTNKLLINAKTYINNNKDIRIISFQYTNDDHIKVYQTSFPSFISYINHIATQEYATAVINSIEHIMKLHPFNSFPFLKNLLKLAFTQSDSPDEFISPIEIWEYLQNQSLYDDTDYPSIKVTIDKINNLHEIIKCKILVTIVTSFGSLSNQNYDDLINSSDDICGILLDMISYTHDNEIIQTSLNCISFLIINCFKNKKTIANGIRLINCLQELEREFPLAKELKEKAMECAMSSSVCQNKIHENETSIGEYQIIADLFSQLEKIEILFERSYILHQIDNQLLKILSRGSIIGLEEMKMIYSSLFTYLKQHDTFISSNALRSLSTLFEIAFQHGNLKYIEFYFHMIKDSVKSQINTISTVSSKNEDVICLQVQAIAKIFELVGYIVKRITRGVVLICNHVIALIFEIFDEFLSQLDHTVIASSFSILSTVVNYAPLEVSNYLSVLIKTSLNFLRESKYNPHNDIKRGAGILLFSIIRSCEFAHFATHAEEMYKTIKYIYDTTNDSVLKFHLKRCIDLVQRSVEQFYTECDLAITSNMINLP